MPHDIATMKTLLADLLPEEGVRETGIPGLSLVRRDKAYEALPLLYEPEIIILAQGRKRVHVGDRTYTYDANNYFVLTVPLPVVCEALIVPGEPLLGLVLKLDPRLIGEVLADLDGPPPRGGEVGPGLYQAPLGPDLIDAAIRLLRALGSKDEAKVLGPLCVREILYRVLTGQGGDLLKDLAFGNRNLFQISRVVSLIREQYSRPLDVHTLAREAGMSVSAFHANFRAVTSTSPLQYLKTTRLHRAKELIQRQGEKASQAALLVGYESPSQFSREYKRFFGVSPTQDRQILSAG